MPGNCRRNWFATKCANRCANRCISRRAETTDMCLGQREIRRTQRITWCSPKTATGTSAIMNPDRIRVSMPNPRLLNQ